MAGLLDYLEAIGETGAMLGTGAVSGAVGMPYGVYKGIRSGKYGTPEGVRIAEEEARRFMERNTYQPRSQMAQNAIGYAGGLLSDARIPPIIPEAAALSAIPLRPAARMAGEGVAATGRFVAPKVGQLAEQYMVNTGGILPLDVYHDTPHRFPPTPRNPLGEFDASKIGTGEGAQAYGHGLYFAENKNIAQNYADVLASPRNRVMDKTGVYIEPSPMGDGTYRLARQSEMGKMRGSVGDATQGLTDYQYPNLAAAIKGAKKQGYLPKNSKVQLNAIGEDGKYVPVRSASDVTEEKFGFGPEYAQFIASEPGNLYKVDLPDEKIAKMLDWDKPMTEQEMIGIYDKMQQSPLASFAKPFQDNFYESMNRGQPTIDGQDLFMELSKQLGGQKYVSDFLKSIDIPGIKYLDEGSRSAGKGTRNFVVFPGEEKSMTILERNAQRAEELKRLQAGGLLAP